MRLNSVSVTKLPEAIRADGTGTICTGFGFFDNDAAACVVVAIRTGVRGYWFDGSKYDPSKARIEIQTWDFTDPEAYRQARNGMALLFDDVRFKGFKPMYQLLDDHDDVVFIPAQQGRGHALGLVVEHGEIKPNGVACPSI